MSGPRPEGSPFHSQEDLRRYVESELDLSIRMVRPELRVDFGAREFTVVPRIASLCWLIEQPRGARSERMSDRHYLLEARYASGEFVIWFGGVHGTRSTGASTRDVILPAVHVPFSLIDRASRPVHATYALASVLRWMLDHSDRAPGDGDPLVYPMNGHLHQADSRYPSASDASSRGG